MENTEEITKKAGEDQFLEFKEEFRERDKIKLREEYFGEPLSQEEVKRYLTVKDRLVRLMREKREQEGLVYVLHLKKKNHNIDEEIKKTGDEYSELLTKIRGKTGYSNEEVAEYIEEGRIKKIRYYLSQIIRENEEESKDKSPAKKSLFTLLKNIGKEKRSKAVISVALMGMPIKVPYTGITSLIVSGMRSEFLPFNISQKDTNMGTSIFKIASTEKKMKKMQSSNFFFDNPERGIDYGSQKEFELRNLKIEMPDKKEEKQNIAVKEKPATEEKKIEVSKPAPEIEVPKPPKQEIKKEPVIKKNPEKIPVESKKIEKPKEKIRDPDTITVESFGVIYHFPKKPYIKKEKPPLEEKEVSIEKELLN